MDIERRDLRRLQALLGVIVGVLVIFALRELRQIFIPLFLALFLYFLFIGTVVRLRRWGIPKLLVLAGVLSFIFITLCLLALLVYTGATTFIEQFPSYSGQIVKSLQALSVKLKIPLADVNQYIQHIDWNRMMNPTQVSAMLSTALGSFTSFMGNLVLVLLFLMFMLGGRRALADRVGRRVGRERLASLQSIVDAIEREVEHYLGIKTVVSLFMALVGALILYLGGVDFVIFSALLIFLLNYIPTFGSLVSTVFPVVLGFVKFGFGWRMVLVTLALMTLQFVTGNVMEPKITGRRLNLSPMTILISLIFWGWLWGALGMILAVPITSSLKITFEHIENLKVLAAVMSAE